MKKRIWSKAVSIFTAILLVVGIVPNTTITALAVGEEAPAKLYVGNQNVKSGEDTTYWPQMPVGELTPSNETVLGMSNTPPTPSH